MATIKRILVPTDLSQLSQVAFDYAATFAKHHRATIYLVHVMEPAPAMVPTALGISTDAFEKRMVKEASAALDRLAQRFGKNVKPVLRRGNVAQELLKAAKSTKANLIVMSTHGRSGIGHVLVGSVAEKIVRQARCPVLTVKPTR